MSINSTIKKAGIEIVRQLNTFEVNSISSSISNKLVWAFSEHNLDKSSLFASICRINMYIAKMPQDSSFAKYFYKNNSIYFSDNVPLDKMPDVAVHECIHFIQEIKDDNNNLISMGLYNLSSGLALNEASVQLMSSEANKASVSQEIYYGIFLNTISPDYYPLECALVKQMSYFTGTYPLYHSTLNGNDVFKNTFTLKSSKKIYKTIEKSLDLLLQLEDDLNCFSLELQYTDKISSINSLNKLINNKKKDITNLFFKTQNLILKNCFFSEFNNIRSLEDIKIFKKRLYEYKNLIGHTDNYTFYNDFYCKMMNELEKKRDFIMNNGIISLFDMPQNRNLALLDVTLDSMSFAHKFILKIKKLFGLNKSIQDINDY